MNVDPIELALRHVSETKNLLDSLITSSESFDYHKAKAALKALEKKSRELGKLRAALEVSQAPVAANVIKLSAVAEQKQTAAWDCRTPGR